MDPDRSPASRHPHRTARAHLQFPSTSWALLADASRRTADMPLYTLRNRASGATIETTDPGRALITGRWKDVARFKGPILRGLAARPPYFHNGFAATLPEVVDFYDSRFAISFTAQEKSDLVAFLTSL